MDQVAIESLNYRARRLCYLKVYHEALHIATMDACCQPDFTLIMQDISSTTFYCYAPLKGIGNFRSSPPSRFSTIVPTVQNIRSNVATEHQVSAANRRLAQQLANRPGAADQASAAMMYHQQQVMMYQQQQQQQMTRGGGRGGRGAAVAPQGLNKGNLKQRLGKSNIKNRLSLPQSGTRGGRGGQFVRGGNRGRGARGGNITNKQAAQNIGGDGQTTFFKPRGRGGFSPRARGRGGAVFRGRGTFNRFTGQTIVRGGGRGQRRGGGRGALQRGRGRGGRGGAAKNVTAQDLDSQLDDYMSKTKTHLDSQLDAYMSEMSA